ncbi:hypothetical protein MVEN_01241300 [Mycena venus]|uniref:F-box domain-containing protein n=1 Tax=Mycena venus TaxID=2733690 RepID=A0A8H7CWC5_9AGAR|nr:hypothetical protein MVEN_01241300 [Mycena venus]
MPELPPELEREILVELVFKADRQNLNLKLTLCLVARRVQFWIDSIFYEVVSLTSQRSAVKFLTLVRSNEKPPGFFTVVKRLCLTVAVKAVTAFGILGVCTAVEALACWVDFYPEPDLPVLISRLPLRRLSIEFHHFSRIPLNPSTWLSSLTHLELFTWLALSAPDLSRLAHLPCLTFVAVNNVHMSKELVAEVRTSCPRLQALVLLQRPNEIRRPYLRMAQNDPHIVVQEQSRNPVQDWEAAHFGYPDMWSRAEASMVASLVGG